MTTGKPNNPTFLTPDRPIGANVNKGFADTFNWLVRFCNNLQGDGYYINVENEQGDQPVITWGDTPPGAGLAETRKDADLSDSEYSELGLTPQKTIQTVTFQGESEPGEQPSEISVVQLYDFHNPSNVTEIDKDTIENYDFLMRGKDEHSVIYASVSGLQELLDGGGGGGGCSCDLVPTLSSGTKIADWTKDGTNFTSIYSPSDVVQFSGTDGSSTVKADAFTFQSASDSNIVITCNGNNIEIGCYYL